jgi:hypothetical protein
MLAGEISVRYNVQFARNSYLNSVRVRLDRCEVRADVRIGFRQQHTNLEESPNGDSSDGKNLA